MYSKIKTNHSTDLISRDLGKNKCSEYIFTVE